MRKLDLNEAAGEFEIISNRKEFVELELQGSGFCVIIYYN